MQTTALGGGDRERARQGGRPLPHAEHAQGVGSLEIPSAGAPAVVLDLHPERVSAKVEPDLHRVGVRVSDDVGERLLEDAEECRRHLGIDLAVAAPHVDRTRNAGAYFEVADCPLGGRCEPEAVENIGPEAGADPVADLDGRVGDGDHGVVALLELPALEIVIP